MFDPVCFRRIARETAAIAPQFDSQGFLALTLPGLDDLGLLQRLRRMTEALRETLPSDYRKAVGVLRKLAPKVERGFVATFLPDFVALYGLDDFDESMDALKFFTPFGSSEFGIRPFLRQDLPRTLKIMKAWSLDPDEHVRRLASEGCRPRLPWSFRLEALVRDPTPVARILENLKSDPSLYVRKSVANHLNDISKDHPDWVLERLAGWDLSNPRTGWIGKQGLRTLIKSGDLRALALIGADRPAEVQVSHLAVNPARILLGETLTLTLEFRSTSSTTQTLVVDYIVDYVKKSGGTAPKVFKWKELRVGSGEVVVLQKRQMVKNFTTRVHYPGRHAVRVMINGAVLAESAFRLVV